MHLSEQATCTTTDRCSVLLLPATLLSSVWLLCCCASQDVEDLLARAMEKRTVGCTQLNEQSSRSHAVFTLRIEGVNDSSKLKVGLQGCASLQLHLEGPGSTVDRIPSCWKCVSL